MAAVIVRAGRVLLVQRGHPPAEGLWTLPGGGVEAGEAVGAALVREVREETGLTITPGPLVEIFEVIERDAAGGVQYHFVILDYLAESSGMDAGQAATDAAGLAWVEWDRVDEYPVTPGLGGVLAKARAMLGEEWARR